MENPADSLKELKDRLGDESIGEDLLDRAVETAIGALETVGTKLIYNEEALVEELKHRPRLKMKYLHVKDLENPERSRKMVNALINGSYMEFNEEDQLCLSEKGEECLRYFKHVYVILNG